MSGNAHRDPFATSSQSMLLPTPYRLYHTPPIYAPYHQYQPNTMKLKPYGDAHTLKPRSGNEYGGGGYKVLRGLLLSTVIFGQAGSVAVWTLIFSGPNQPVSQ